MRYSMPGSPQPLTVAEVAHRLGVKRETVYAYVSRGLLERHPASARRDSLFEPAAVERLAGRARRPDRSGALEVVIETELTALDPAGRLAFRGRDVTELARFRHFEDVAALLWDGDAHGPWTLPNGEAERMAALRGLLPADTPAVDLIPPAVATLAAWDPARGDRRPDAVRRAGARMLAGALEILAPAGDLSGTGAAQRLWPAVRRDGHTPRPAQLAALDAALVLLADHELAASTLAARVAASAWADPYRVMLAGLGPLGGALHGAAGPAAEALLDDAARLGPFAALDQRIATGGVPGFGHRVYRDRDPRADHLLGRLASLAGDGPEARLVAEVVEGAAERGLPAPNVDLGVAAVARTMGLQPGASSLIFTVARMVGLVAHALEEYPHRLRFRPRATYVGPAPAGG
jgi:citrate synthase